MTAKEPCPAQDGAVADAAHLEICDSCREHAAALESFDAAMRESHLTSDEIVDAAWTEVRDPEPHLAACDRCRQEVEAVRAARARLGDGSPSRAFLPSRWSPALAALLLAGLGLALWPQGGRDQGPSATIRGDASQIGGLAPSGEVARSSALAFVWKGRPAERYALSFFSEDGRPLMRIEVLGTTKVMDGDARRQLEREASYFWRVESLDDPTVSASRLTRVVWKPE